MDMSDIEREMDIADELLDSGETDEWDEWGESVKDEEDALWAPYHDNVWKK